jgi:hypothetical protein
LDVEESSDSKKLTSAVGPFSYKTVIVNASRWQMSFKGLQASKAILRHNFQLISRVVAPFANNPADVLK